MEQDDLIGGGIFQDRRFHLCRVPLFPVPGVDGPLDHGHLDQIPVRRVHGAVGRAEPIGSPSQQRFQRLLRAAHLLLQCLPGDSLKPHMVPGVAAHLVALCLHPPDQVLIALDLPADQEKGGAGAPLLQAVQQPLRSIPAGAVVKGDGDQLVRREQGVRPSFRHRAARRAAGQQCQGQAQKKQASSPHRAHTSSFMQR